MHSGQHHYASIDRPIGCMRCTPLVCGFGRWPLTEAGETSFEGERNLAAGKEVLGIEGKFQSRARGPPIQDDVTCPVTALGPESHDHST